MFIPVGRAGQCGRTVAGGYHALFAALTAATASRSLFSCPQSMHLPLATWGVHVKVLRFLALAVLAMATCACASRSVKSDPVAFQATIVPASAPSMSELLESGLSSTELHESPRISEADAVRIEVKEKAVNHATEPPIPASHASLAGARSEIASAAQRDETPASDIEDEAALIYGNKQVKDPWEGYNRRIHRLNNAADRFFARPLAITYDKVKPDPVQASIGKFFGNLREPGMAVNEILQGRPVRATQALGRFLVNDTVGVGGLFDPATRFGMPQYKEDLCQTFAMWGWRDSRYLVLPLLGPRTARGSVGMLGERPLSPLGYVKDSMMANGLSILQLADGHSRMLPMDEMRKGTVDDYALVRDMWMQHRSRRIDQDRRPPRE